MGTRIQNLANNFTTAGIVKAAAVNNTTVSGITSLPSGVGGSLTLISTQTASASASIEFTSGIDSTYSSYVFKFIDIHPDTDNVRLEFNGSTDGGSNYNVVKTTTSFRALNNEADTEAEVVYVTAGDLAQSTSNQFLTHNNIGGDNDQSAVGYLYLYNPSSNVFVKHFIAQTNAYNPNDYTIASYYGGYFNTTSPINALKFVMNSGTFNGIIKMYGVS